jgi:hypothetical protein
VIAFGKITPPARRRSKPLRVLSVVGREEPQKKS